MARGLNLQLIAGAWRTGATRVAGTGGEVNVAQGFLFARPVPADVSLKNGICRTKIPDYKS